MACKERLEAYFRKEQVPFGVHPHPVAPTAQAVVEREHLPAQLMVKLVAAVADGELVMLAMPTSRRADLARLGAALDAREVRLAGEHELAQAFPDCEPGAMPPFGNLYGVRVYVDRALEGDRIIFFQAGSHTLAMSVAYADFKRLVAPIVIECSKVGQRPHEFAHGDVQEAGGS